MRTFIFYMVAIALLSGCHTYNKDVIRIEEQGSFAVGGTVLTDSLGHNYHGDHAYVFYQKPVDARKYPLVFAHGVGQFSKTWETTPDGREGFQNIFLRRASPLILSTNLGVAMRDVARKPSLYLLSLMKKNGLTVSVWGYIPHRNG